MGKRRIPSDEVLATLPPEYRDNALIQFSAELSTVFANDRLVVLVAHGFAELLTNALIEHHLRKHGKTIVSRTRDYPHATKLLLLNEFGVLSDRLYRHLDRFRKIRNDAAHEVYFQLTADELAPFPQLASLPRTGYSCFMNLIGAFWNEHREVLSPLFAPTPPKPNDSTGTS